MEISFITGNKHKYGEAVAIIPELMQIELDLPEIQALTIEDVATAKIEEALKHVDGEVIVEDTGVVIVGMKGLPGVMTKWFMKSIGNEGLVRLASEFGSAAYAQTTIGYSNGGKFVFFTGKVDGNIVSPRGDNGFGWDPVFEVVSVGKTLAEMTQEEKNQISTRKIALEKLRSHLGV